MADGKWITGLAPDMSVAEAAKVVLAARFEVVRQELPLVLDKPYENPEHVHQLRVGTRRAAAALRVFKDCFPRKPLRAVKSHLRNIRQAAGDARDWDVFRLGLPTAKPLTTSAGKPALDFLLGYAIGERSAAQIRLVDAVVDDGPRFSELSTAFPQLAEQTREPDQFPNFGTLAAVQFGQLLGAFDDAVKANPTEPHDLHQLRILGKRTRYALEIFVSCFPPAFKDAVYPAVEHAQELLGEIQDAAVGRDRLMAMRERVKKAMPEEWPRLRKGFEGLISSMRTKIPGGRKAFQAWHKDWDKLINAVKLEIATATTTASAAPRRESTPHPVPRD
ncbi:MAG: CHAD domain-containing protein [Gemmataceae bacterium]